MSAGALLLITSLAAGQQPAAVPEEVREQAVRLHAKHYWPRVAMYEKQIADAKAAGLKGNKGAEAGLARLKKEPQYLQPYESTQQIGAAGRIGWLRGVDFQVATIGPEGALLHQLSRDGLGFNGAYFLLKPLPMEIKRGQRVRLPRMFHFPGNTRQINNENVTDIQLIEFTPDELAAMNGDPPLVADSKKPAAAAPGKPPPMPGPEPGIRLTVHQDSVRVDVKLTAGRAYMAEVNGSDTVHNEEVAAFEIGVSTSDPSEKRTLRRWSLAGGATLADDLGNRYVGAKPLKRHQWYGINELPPVIFAPPTINGRPVGGRPRGPAVTYTGRETEVRFDSNKGGDDVLVFERLVPAAKRATLTLAGGNLGLAEDCVFHLHVERGVPVSTERLPLPPPEPEPAMPRQARKNPAPATTPPPTPPANIRTLHPIGGKLVLARSEATLADYEKLAADPAKQARMAAERRMLVLTAPAEFEVVKLWEKEPTLRVIPQAGKEKGDTLYCRRSHLDPPK